MTEAEKWELKQLGMSGVMSVQEHPLYDEEGGLGVLAAAEEDVEEEFEIDLNDEEPEFLKGHSTKSGVEMSPIKIVKNPEGSMQRAAMTQVGGNDRLLVWEGGKALTRWRKGWTGSGTAKDLGAAGCARGVRWHYKWWDEGIDTK